MCDFLADPIDKIDVLKVKNQWNMAKEFFKVQTNKSKIMVKSLGQ